MSIFCKIIFPVFFLSVLINETTAQKLSFGGGMGCQFQYANISTDYAEVSGLAWGIGGRLHCNIGNHYRIGGLGSTWGLSYSQKSYFKMGYGGLTAEYVIKLNSSRIALGVLLGGGNITNLQVKAATPDGNVIEIYKTYSTSIFAPMFT